jgi:hypothetical protein
VVDLVYRLMWGMEAARVYEDAQGNPSAVALDGSALTAIETDTFMRPASILIRAGFDHRGTAIEQTDATFDSTGAMPDWIAQLDPEVTRSPTGRQRSPTRHGDSSRTVQGGNDADDGDDKPRGLTASPGPDLLRRKAPGCV